VLGKSKGEPMPDKPAVEKIRLDDLQNTHGNPNRQLVDSDFNAEGEIVVKDAELALVVQSAANAKAYIANRQ
jgi:hypothetical protein